MSQIATALLSGLLGALIVQLLNWLVASRAAVRRFQAAVRVVLDELQANISNLKIISNDRDPAKSLRLVDGSYRAVELILAERLKPIARQKLGQAYVPVRVPRVLYREVPYTPLNTTDVKLTSQPLHEQIDAALAAMREARDILRSYLPKGDPTAGGTE